ncbi:Transaldolase [Dermatophilus congolensis]|uniref:Transaldolase n=1 Tax=Dermatophilus congolensis TaxID=1863 RepID=A0AA46H0F0_9MICO|nr:transaldolase [Dermatophilus congolensis]STD09164.1 Transaldolase [Dermatophilus congolensis]
MTINSNIKALADAGVSVWLDDLSRTLISSGNLQKLIDESGVVGVTTNPTIFATALSNGEAYADQVAQLAAANTPVDDAVFAITTDDVRNACDVLKPIYDATGGKDGRVSIEVDPRLAHETDATVDMAKKLYATVDRENVMIKIPATTAGLPAITAVLAEGISVNVTLIFSLDQYRGVLAAFIEGIEKAKEAGKDISKIHSVASFFVSRVDTEIDPRLEKIGTDEALALRGKAAIANARLAYQVFEEAFATSRWDVLEAAGANKQRALWASTGVKNPEYDDTMYVVDLAAPHTVNTMPGKTLEAVADHGKVRANAIAGSYEDSQATLDKLAALGISYDEVVTKLEKEGVEKFEKSWTELLDSLTSELEAKSK